MDFHILGPLEALDGGEQVALEGSKLRAVLALLLLHRGEPLSSDRLIDELWGEQPPATAAKTLQVQCRGCGRRSASESGGAADVVVTAPTATGSGSSPSRSTPIASSGCWTRAEVSLRPSARAGAAGARTGARAVARPRPRRPRVRGVRAGGDRPARGPARGRDRAADRGGARARPPHGGGRRARGADRRAPVPRAPACAADARALQVRSPGRRPAGVPGRGASWSRSSDEPGQRLRELEAAILAQDPGLAVPAVAEGASRRWKGPRRTAPRRRPSSCPRAS